MDGVGAEPEAHNAIAEPKANQRNTLSTRRFLARPASLVLLDIGAYGPTPSLPRRSRLTAYWVAL